MAGSFTKRATRELLKEQGQKLVTFDVAQSLDEVKAQIRKMGEVTRHPDRAEADVARIDAAIARTRRFVAKKRYRVLSISRRGWVSGSRSLMSSLVAEVGLSNAAGDLGLKSGGFASLEAIISLRPDFILVSNDSDFAEDEGRAFLLHPALEHFYPSSKRLVVPERLTVCGGPMVAEALDRIVSEIMRAERAADTAAARADMLSWSDTLTVTLVALVVDAVIGDPDWLWRRLAHPVAIMGRAIAASIARSIAKRGRQRSAGLRASRRSCC